VVLMRCTGEHCLPLPGQPAARSPLRTTPPPLPPTPSHLSVTWCALPLAPSPAPNTLASCQHSPRYPPFTSNGTDTHTAARTTSAPSPPPPAPCRAMLASTSPRWLTTCCRPAGSHPNLPN
jgi:hypothetical protein